MTIPNFADKTMHPVGFLTYAGARLCVDGPLISNRGLEFCSRIEDFVARGYFDAYPGGRTGGLSLAAGTSQAPQFVAPEANIRRDDHRGLHDARRRFNLAKSHGAR